MNLSIALAIADLGVTMWLLVGVYVVWRKYRVQTAKDNAIHLNVQGDSKVVDQVLRKYLRAGESPVAVAPPRCDFTVHHPYSRTVASCIREAGHEGPHRTEDGGEWTPLGMSGGPS